MKIQSYLSYIFLLLSVAFQNLSAQCTPPMAEVCEEASVLCSLDELNGYACTNQSTIASPCVPLCSQGGVGNNTSWWGFVTQGGNITITLTVGSCTLGQGIEFGIWSDCVCGEEIACHSNPCAPPASVNTINGNLSPCRTYYLWVDGCNGDVCDFTLSTSGGGPPSLAPLSKINNKANMIIGPVCTGACDFLLFVDPQPGGCEPTYVWTLDGDEYGGSGNQISVNFPEGGDFVVCVTAYIGNPQSGSICSQQGPQCATVKVQQLKDRIGLPQEICFESIYPKGYKWHTQWIYSPGVYSQQFTDANCCIYDSIVEFINSDPQLIEDVFFITCDSTPFVDRLGKKYFPCQYKSKILLNLSGDPFRCDSSISLTAVNVNFAPSWATLCKNGMVELVPNISIVNPCKVGESYEFEYKWFKKKNPSQSISTDERLVVPSVSEDYCLEVSVKTQLGNEIDFCTKTFCETIDESILSPECLFTLIGKKVFCFDSKSEYRIDSLFSSNVNFYNWSINGGTIISNPDSSVIEVKWSFNPQDTGKICASYNTDCGTSCQKCLTVSYETQIAGDDFEKRGLSAYLDARPQPNGSWRVISGPYQVTIHEPNNPRTKITAYNYGYYCFEWTVSDPKCVMKDTLCVNLHSFKKASPEYPKLLFYERASSDFGVQHTQDLLFTPNLIENDGESFVTFDVDESGIMKYKWIDIYGRSVSEDELSIETGIQRMNIYSPDKSGMYFLVIELNGISSVRKVCVAN